jgi:hypothetical protein
MVRKRDPRGIISKNLLDWHGSPSYEATNRSWNRIATVTNAICTLPVLQSRSTDAALELSETQVKFGIPVLIVGSRNS